MPRADHPTAVVTPADLSANNQRLLLESEAVRSVLAERETLRRREAAALAESNTLFAALEALSGERDATSALQALLACLKTRLAIEEACYAQAAEQGVRVLVSVEPGQAGLVLPIPPRVLERPRRMGSIAPLLPRDAMPEQFPALGATLIAPVAIPGEAPGALLLGSAVPGRFSSGDLRLMERIGRMAGHSLTALREVRRNALLASLVEGRGTPAGGGVLDAPFEAVNRAFSRLTEAQGHMVAIQDALLSAPLDRTDAAIEDALDQLGRLMEIDRVYVVRLSADGALVTRTHEWCAPGVASMREHQQAAPASVIQPWHEALNSLGEVQIHDVAALPDAAAGKLLLAGQGVRSWLAVALVQDGVCQGLLGFDAVRGLRHFLPGKVHLFRSVAKVMAAILSRRDAEEAVRQAHLATSRERARLLAVLSAMPELMLELDAQGCFMSCHAGATLFPALVAEERRGAPLETLLPAAGAEAVRRMLAEMARGELAKAPALKLDLGGGERWWRISLTTIPASGHLLVLRDISDARRQTKEIELLSQIARRTTDLVVVTDPQRRIEWVNAAFERTTGWQLADVRGRTPASVLQSEATDSETIARIRQALDTESAVQAELLNSTRDGRQYWVQLHIQPLRDAQGVLTGFMSVQSDITERRRQQALLVSTAKAAADARATLEAAVETLQDGFVLCDAQDRLVLCNRRYREMYALSGGAIDAGMSFEEGLRFGLAQGQYREAVGREEEWLAERLAQHRSAASEIEQQLADGRWVRIFEKATPDGGRVGLRVDITALKLAERRALADRSAAMEASQDGIAITDAQGLFVYINRAHLALFGLREDAEVLGKPWSMLYSEEGAAWMVANAMPRLFSEGRWSGEILGRAVDGRAVDQDVSLTLQTNGGILFITRDIRERRREAAERERLRAELQLAQRREVIGQMAAGLAHDFNNLLAVIAGSAELIAVDAPDGTPAASSAARIRMASDQAAGLVRRLLTFGAHEGSRTLLDLRKPLREAADLVRASMRAPAHLVLELPDEAVEASAEPTDLLQVLLNLGINARDALAGEAGEVRITLSPPATVDAGQAVAVGRLEPGRAYACLSVADSGAGMPATVAANVFRPYFSTKAEKGTGLGLAVVSSIVTGNGGAVVLDTSPGQGSCFRVYWPIDGAPAATPPAAAAPGGRLDGRAVLVVDDVPDVLAITVGFLEAAGAEVAPSTEPDDVLQALRDDPTAWALLVTDFDMPGMNGAELARAARQIAPGLPVLLVTAFTGAADRVASDFDAVLAKPVSREALISAAEAAILRAAAGGAACDC